MAAPPVSQPPPGLLPLPSTPLTNSVPPPANQPPPPPDLSAPPPTIPSPPPPEAAPPPTVTLPLPLPPPSDPPSPPPPIPSSLPDALPSSPPPPTPEINPPPPSPPPADEPSPAVVTLSPPPSTSSPPPSASSPPPSRSSPPPPDSTKSNAPPPSSTATTTTTWSPPPPHSNSPSHLAPPPPTKYSKHSGSTPTTSTSSTPGANITGDFSSNDGDQAVRTGIAVGVVAAVVIIGFLMAIVCMQRRRKRHDRYNSVYMLPSQFASSRFPTPQFPSPPDSGNPLGSGSSFVKPNPSVGGGGDYMSSQDSGIIANSQTWFTYEQLSIATSGFASHNILGTGGFGCVYKGILQDGQVVAVKKLKDTGGQGDREFKAEVETVSRVHHRYLVSLVGYCIADNHRLLVYEYVPNNTLHYHIHATNKPAMQWSLRVKVACGSARGLAYLHEDCHPKIIHRDIKTANILLDANFDAKVADFGLAKMAQELELNTHVSTRVMGTFGYMAPEYASSGKLTEKSDVFSFGVVLLELITGRKPVDEKMPLGDESLVEWARPLMSEALESQNFSELADPKLEGNYDLGEMFRMIEAAAACVRHSASKRPKMSQVVRALDTMSELSDISNGMKPGQSGIFNSREQSAQIKMFQRMAFGSQDFSSEHGNSQGSFVSGGRSGIAGGTSGMV